MKNGLLKSFVLFFVILNIIFFSEISAILIVLSDMLWSAVNFDVMCVVLGVAIAIVFVVFLIYFFKNKTKDQIVETVEFKSPDEMTPAEIGFLIDGVVDSSDMSALLVYWAGKKYLKISKTEKSQKLTKLVEKLPNNARPYEKKLFKAIFGEQKEILVGQISDRLSGNEVLSNSVRSIEKVIGKKYFNKKTLWLRQVFVCVFAALFYFSIMYFRLEYYVDFVPIIEIFAIVSTALFVIAADFYLRYYDYRHKNNASKGRLISFILLCVLLAVMAGLCVWFFWTDFYQLIFLLCLLAVLFVVCLLSSKFNIYKKEGQEKLGQVLGFKNFIEVAEKDRIKVLVEEDPKIFYEVLPYAFVLGVSEKWIEKFDVIKTEMPALFNDNFVGNMIAFQIVFRNSTLNFATMMRYARFANYGRLISSTGSRISLGSNGGRGGTKGGSNFGGIRRR